MPANDADVNIERFKYKATVIAAIVGPIIALGCSVVYSRLNHAESAQGYATLAKIQNDHAEHIGQLTARMDRIEKAIQVAASQPTVAPTHINIQRFYAAKAPTKAPAAMAARRAPLTLKAAQTK